MRAIERMSKGWLALGVAMALSACGGGGPSEEATEAASEPAATAVEPAPGGPPPAFAQCMACHSVQPGVNGVGPSLFGVIGRKAGTEPGYAYSEPMKAWGKVLDEATIDEWLTAPMKDVPGTKMVFPGIPDPARRQEVIDYLKTLK